MNRSRTDTQPCIGFRRQRHAPDARFISRFARLTACTTHTSPESVSPWLSTTRPFRRRRDAHRNPVAAMVNNGTVIARPTCRARPREPMRPNKGRIRSTSGARSSVTLVMTRESMPAARNARCISNATASIPPPRLNSSTTWSTRTGPGACTVLIARCPAGRTRPGRAPPALRPASTASHPRAGPGGGQAGCRGPRPPGTSPPPRSATPGRRPGSSP